MEQNTTPPTQTPRTSETLFRLYKKYKLLIDEGSLTRSKADDGQYKELAGWAESLELELLQAQRERDEANMLLGEAQQWIDSEPDWKDKYMANYDALQKQNDQLLKDNAKHKEWIMNQAQICQRCGNLLNADRSCNCMTPPKSQNPIDDSKSKHPDAVKAENSEIEQLKAETTQLRNAVDELVKDKERLDKFNKEPKELTKMLEDLVYNFNYAETTIRKAIDSL